MPLWVAPVSELRALRLLVRHLIQEEYLGTAGGVRYYQMGGSLPKSKYNLDDEGHPTYDPGVAVLRKKKRKKKKKKRRVDEAKTGTDRRVKSVLEDWVERGIKASRGPHMFPPRELFRYREFHRRTRPDLQKSMKEKGFDPKRPIRLQFGKNGGVKVDEGNHRLKTAIQLELDEVPVVFEFVDEVVKGTVAKSEWQQTQDRKTLQRQQREKRRAAERKALGIKDMTPEERAEMEAAMTPEQKAEREEQIEELMGLLGGF